MVLHDEIGLMERSKRRLLTEHFFLLRGDIDILKVDFPLQVCYNHVSCVQHLLSLSLLLNSLLFIGLRHLINHHFPLLRVALLQQQLIDVHDAHDDALFVLGLATHFSNRVVEAMGVDENGSMQPGDLFL